MSDDIIKAGSSENDLDNADFDDVSGFDDDFGTGGGTGQTLGELLKHSPMFKLGLIIGAVALVIGTIILFGGTKEVPKTSRLSRASTANEAPGQEVSPSYEEAIADFNVTQVEEAIRRGESALPVPVGTTRGRVGLQEEQAQAEDPLDRWRRIQEERQKRTQGQRPNLPSVDPNAEQINQLSKLMQTQMESVLSSKVIAGAQKMDVTAHDWVDQRLAAAQSQDAAASDSQRGDSANDVAQIILPAGTIEYAQLLIEANSDAVGPVLAQIVSGPLSGSRILGSFKTEEEYLVLSFNQVVIDGVSHRADAVALDPETTGIGIVTDIDQRYFKRVILPAAAKFIEGMAGAIADRGSTIVVVGDTALQQEEKLNTNEQIYKGVEEAASSVSDLLEEEADRTRPQIKVRAGTPIGLLFVQPVLENKSGGGAMVTPASASGAAVTATR